MNIGVVVDNELDDDKRVLREMEILKEAGHGIFVLCFGFDKKKHKTIEGINVRRIMISNRLKNILFFFLNIIPVYEWLWSVSIKKFITTNEIDTLHVHDLYMSRAGKTGIRMSGRKILMILDLHENYPFAVTTYNWTRGFLRNLLSQPHKWMKKEKEYLLYADAIIVLSTEFSHTLIARYPELSADQFIVFPNVPDLKEMESKGNDYVDLTLNNNKVVVLYFGVVAERRGIFDVLDVFTWLAAENQPINFLIIGPVDKKDRKKFFNKINSDSLKDVIYYVPWIDQNELPYYLEKTDICIAPFRKNPQHESGVANKIFDYMLGKKPVIASDCGPQRNLIEKYKCGIIYTNPGELKQALVELSEDPGLCEELGENGRIAIIEEYNTGIQGRILLDGYGRITDGK